LRGLSRRCEAASERAHVAQPECTPALKYVVNADSDLVMGHGIVGMSRSLCNSRPT
jgi:hypothetical protein